jgi:hypothetical protein
VLLLRSPWFSLFPAALQQPLVLPKQQENENQRVFRPLVFTKQQQENKSQPFGFSFPAAGAGKTKAKDKTIPKLMFYLLKSVQQE